MISLRKLHQAIAEGNFFVKAALFLFMFFLSNSIWAETESERDLVMAVKEYFDNYYKDLSEMGVVKSKNVVIDGLETILGLEKTQDIEELNNRLNSRLNKLRKHVNIFLIPGEDKVQCWLGEMVEERNGVEVIWGKEIKYILRKIDNLIVHDYVYFSTKGLDALDAGVKGNIIYYNLEAFRDRARENWQILLETNTRDSISKPYDPLRYNRLRRKLKGICWRPLYLKSINSYSDLNEAKQNFIIESVKMMTNTSLFHELGHILYSRANSIVDDIDSEVVAFLTELRYSPLPYESLDRVISAAYSSSMEIYKAAGRQILTSFISYIGLQQAKGNKAYKKISIRDKELTEQIKNLYRLTSAQIREISEYVYSILFIYGYIDTIKTADDKI
jgi:hypothetical protein